MPNLDKPLWKKVEISSKPDVSGTLSVIEGGRDINFEIARVYYLHSLQEDAKRGGHAHRELHQVYLALSGQFDVHLTDGDRKETITLDRPDEGLIIRPGVWRTLDSFTAGAICFVLASAHYSEAEYIRDESDFLRYVAERKMRSE